MLENHHLNVLLSVLKVDMANIFINVPMNQRDECVDTIVDGVLATDISRHFELTAYIANKLRSKDRHEPPDRLPPCHGLIFFFHRISSSLRPRSTSGGCAPWPCSRCQTSPIR